MITLDHTRLPAQRLPPQLSVDLRSLLELLAAGHTDKTAARMLNVGLRTVERRVGDLAGWMGASSRFQLGCLSVHYGICLNTDPNALCSLPSGEIR